MSALHFWMDGQPVQTTEVSQESRWDWAQTQAEISGNQLQLAKLFHVSNPRVAGQLEHRVKSPSIAFLQLRNFSPAEQHNC